MSFDFDLIVIGSGSGGSVGAFEAARLGKKVAVFEAGTVGGECPTWACTPAKALLHSAQVYTQIKNSQELGLSSISKFNYSKVKAWKDKVVARTGASVAEKEFKRAGIKLVKEKAEFVSSHSVQAGKKIYSAEKFLIATGSQVFVPPIDGLAETGYLTFKEAVGLKTLPKSIFILGGGPIGCEFTQIFASFGSKVYLAETFSRLLVREDRSVGRFLEKSFTALGAHVLTNCKVTKVARRESKILVYFDFAGKKDVVSVDALLLATGKSPVLDLGLEAAGVKFNNKQLLVNDFLETNISHISAAGDVVGPYQFTHTANYQGELAVENMFSEKKTKANYSAVPRCVFTSPEIATVGISEEEARAKKLKIKKAEIPIAILGRASTSNELAGFVKIITDSKEKILGASIVSPSAGEMIHEVALAMQLKAKASDIASTIHAFPTFSEAIKIACRNLG